MISPCKNKCKIMENSSHCLGCKRTITEIINWTKFTEEQRNTIMLALKHRNIYKDRYDSDDYTRY